jgi:hypothetical protein
MKRRAPSGSLDVSTRPAKRAKATMACNSCRKHKTRCELIGAIEESSPIRCHRCKILAVPCSYEDMDRTLFAHHFSTRAASSNSPTANSPSSLPSPTSSSHVETSRSGREVRRQKPKPSYLGRPQAVGLFGYISNRGTLDWDNAPIDAIRELTKKPGGNSSYITSGGDTLISILPEEQIHYLLDQ